MPETADPSDRRMALLLSVLRLSRQRETLSKLEDALAGIDDGACPWVSPDTERTLLDRARRAVLTTLDSAEALRWEEERVAQAREASRQIGGMQRGEAVPPGTSERDAAAIRAAGEFASRLGKEEALQEGAPAFGGWSLLGHLTLPAGYPWEPTHIWHLKAPDDGAPALVSTGGSAPRILPLAEVEAIAKEMQDAGKAATAFHQAARAHDPVLRAARRDRMQAFFAERAEEERVRLSVRRVGSATLHLRDGRLIRVERAYLAATPAQVTDAQRLDMPPPGKEGGDAEDRLLDAQVWARPLGNGLWRRGRLVMEGDAVLFDDEPGAPGVERADRSIDGRPLPHRLEDDLLASTEIRLKARRSEVYARLLYLALENATFRHADGSVFNGGMRSTGDLVSDVSGSGCYLDWAWSSPSGVLDEEVVSDLAALGWHRG